MLYLTGFPLAPPSAKKKLPRLQRLLGQAPEAELPYSQTGRSPPAPSLDPSTDWWQMAAPLVFSFSQKEKRQLIKEEKIRMKENWKRRSRKCNLGYLSALHVRAKWWWCEFFENHENWESWKLKCSNLIRVFFSVESSLNYINFTSKKTQTIPFAYTCWAWEGRFPII